MSLKKWGERGVKVDAHGPEVALGPLPSARLRYGESPFGVLVQKFT